MILMYVIQNKQVEVEVEVGVIRNGYEHISVIRRSFDSFEGANGSCNTCISKILTSFPSSVSFSSIEPLE